MPPFRRRLASQWRGVGSSFSLAGAAVGLAVVIWFVIADAQNETIEEHLGFAVPVETVAVPTDLATASRVPPVTITVSGRESDVERAAADDFRVLIDLSGLSAGTLQVPIQVQSLNGDLRVRSVTPEAVAVTLEPLVRRVLPVRVVVANSPPLGFVLDEPGVAESTVTVSGIQQLVDLVDRVVAPIDAAGATVDVRLPVTVQARTATGATISGVEIQPPVVNVVVPVRQEIFHGQIAVAPRITGSPAAGFRVAGFEADPLTVTVVGTLEALQANLEASTNPVFLAASDIDVEASVRVIPPAGLALESEIPVAVRVLIEPVRVQAVFLRPVEVIGLDEGLEASVEPSEVEVTVIGPAPLIASLVDTSLRVTADAEELDVGEYLVTLRVGFTTGIEVVEVAPAAVRVRIVTASAATAPASTGSETG